MLVYGLPDLELLTKPEAPVMKLGTYVFVTSTACYVTLDKYLSHLATEFTKLG